VSYQTTGKNIRHPGETAGRSVIVRQVLTPAGQV
jgi:hypothetical protein